MEVKKVYREGLPNVKLIGKRYTNSDRDTSGTFAGQWQKWWQEGYFDTLKQCKRIDDVSGDCLGAMRMTGDGDDAFEYWIGMFFAADSPVPQGYDSVDIPAGDVGVCWLYGNEKSGELYSMEASDLSMKALAENGLSFSE